MTSFDDDALLDELADLLAADHDPPPEVLHAARESFTWRSVDAEIAALTYDSVLDDAPSTVRSAAAQPRVLTFTAGGLTVEVEIDATAGGRRLVGQVVPAHEVRLALLSGSGELASTTADRLGRFVLPLPARPRLLRLRIGSEGGPSVDCATTML